MNRASDNDKVAVVSWLTNWAGANWSAPLPSSVMVTVAATGGPQTDQNTLDSVRKPGSMTCPGR